MNDGAEAGRGWLRKRGSSSCPDGEREQGSENQRLKNQHEKKPGQSDSCKVPLRIGQEMSPPDRDRPGAA